MGSDCVCFCSLAFFFRFSFISVNLTCSELLPYFLLNYLGISSKGLPFGENSQIIPPKKIIIIPMPMYGDLQQSLLVTTRPQHQHHCGISSSGQLLFYLVLIIAITRPRPRWIFGMVRLTHPFIYNIYIEIQIHRHYDR